MTPVRQPDNATAQAPPTALRCFECGEPAYRVPPVEWLVGWGPRPDAAHGDGTPLCPVMGATGYRPADPHPAPAEPASPTGIRPSRPGGTPDRDRGCAHA